MSENIYTVRDYTDLSLIVEKLISKKRFVHSLSVAYTCAFILDLFKCKNYVKEYNCISGPIFCGLVHDIGRELSEENLFNYCKYHKIDLNAEIRENIVLSHGLVAADMAYSFLPNYPSSWSEAIKYHTTGNDTLDDLGLALLIADFTEPNRTFLSSSDRNTIYSNENIYTCALDVINRMILHAEKSKKYNVSSYSLKLKLYLECKLDK